MSPKFKSLFQSSKSRSQSSATATQPPAQTIDGPASTASNLPRPRDAIGPGTHYGIGVLYDPSENSKQAIVDIVFVHGLTGNSYNTWLHKKTGTHWPSALLEQDIPEARILTFGYDADVVNVWNPASRSRLSNHAENMIANLVRKRERTGTETRKILFVAHSLGGLVTECALEYSKTARESHLHPIERCTVGIVFLGVPHCGADLESWASFGGKLVSIVRQTNTDILKVLNPGSEMLRMVENRFHRILELRKDEKYEIAVTCFYEEVAVVGVGVV